jgi:ABC-type dipeptide/oligopeptide/nickel transport system permease component
MMYHLFESEMKSVSAFNGTALSCFSIGSFLLSAIFSIVIGWAFSTKPISEFGNFMLHEASWYIAAVTLIFFGCGLYCLRSKKSIIEQIKRETVSNEFHTRKESKL